MSGNGSGNGNGRTSKIALVLAFLALLAAIAFCAPVIASFMDK